ncbi:tyrosine-type recombinase/integrase [Paractinoplanes toevensis]
MARRTAEETGRLTHRFTALVTECGLPPVRLHDLRHGTAMNALHGSASLHTVQHLLGHSSHAFTADIYGTVPDALARAEAGSTAETILTAIRQVASTDTPEERADGRRRQPHHIRIVRERVRRPASAATVPESNDSTGETG